VKIHSTGNGNNNFVNGNGNVHITNGNVVYCIGTSNGISLGDIEKPAFAIPHHSQGSSNEESSIMEYLRTIEKNQKLAQKKNDALQEQLTSLKSELSALIVKGQNDSSSSFNVISSMLSRGIEYIFSWGKDADRY
jgi:hypothetical protein